MTTDIERWQEALDFADCQPNLAPYLSEAIVRCQQQEARIKELGELYELELARAKLAENKLLLTNMALVAAEKQLKLADAWLEISDDPRFMPNSYVAAKDAYRAARSKPCAAK